MDMAFFSSALVALGFTYNHHIPEKHFTMETIVQLSHESGKKENQ